MHQVKIIIIELLKTQETCIL